MESEIVGGYFPTSESDINWEDSLAPFDMGSCNASFDSSQKFVDFCNYVKVIHHNKGIASFKPYEFQKRLVRMIEEKRFIIGTKFRQGGFTTTLALYGLWKCLSSEGQSIGIIVRSDHEAMRIGEMVNGIIDRLPDWLKVKIGRRSKREIRFSNDSIMWFMHPEASCGRSMTHIMIDEAAYIDNMDSWWKCYYPCISLGGKAIVLSTVNKDNDWFHKVFMDAVNRKNQFNIFSADYMEYPDFRSCEWQDKMRTQLGSEGFKRQYEQHFVVKKDGYDFGLYDEMVMGVFRDLLVEKRLGKSKRIVTIYGTDEKADACILSMDHAPSPEVVKFPFMNLYCTNYMFDSGLKVNYRLNIRTIYMTDMNELINSILEKFRLHYSRPSREIGVGELLIDSVDTNLDAPDCGGEMRVLKYGINLRLIVR